MSTKLRGGVWRLCGRAAVVLGMLCCASWASAAFYSTSITNDATFDALRLLTGWSASLKQAKLKMPDLATITMAKTAPVNTAKNWKAEAPLFQLIAKNKEGKLVWEDVHKDPAKLTGGTWIPFLMLGSKDLTLPVNMPAKITKDKFQAVSATFQNDQPFAVHYTDVQLWLGNDLLNYNIDGFQTPSGTQIGPTASFTLDALGGLNDSLTISFGTLSPGTYPLVLATVASSSNPSELIDLVTAGSVPEPTCLALLAIGLFALPTLRWRSR